MVVRYTFLPDSVAGRRPRTRDAGKQAQTQRSHKRRDQTRRNKRPVTLTSWLCRAKYPVSRAAYGMALPGPSRRWAADSGLPVASAVWPLKRSARATLQRLAGPESCWRHALSAAASGIHHLPAPRPLPDPDAGVGHFHAAAALAWSPSSPPRPGLHHRLPFGLSSAPSSIASITSAATNMAPAA